MSEVPFKRCAGVPKLGLPAHDQALDQFAKNAARPDGRARVCSRCWATYTQALKAAKAAAAPAPSEPAPEAVERALTEAQHLGLPRGTAERIMARNAEEAVPVPVPDLEAELAAVGGYATEAGQQMLREAAKRSDEGRRLYQREQKRAERARKKAAQQV